MIVNVGGVVVGGGGGVYTTPPIKGGDSIPPTNHPPYRRDETSQKLGGVIPPFKMLIDTREQTPLPFPDVVPTERTTLYPGDYSIDGLTDTFAIERKSIDDLIGSLIGHKMLTNGTRRNNRDRLIEELLAMRDFRFKAVVVTGPRYAIEGHQYQSGINPNNVMGMIASIEAFTGVQFKFYTNAEEAARWVAVEALHFWRNANGVSSLRPKLKAERLTIREKKPKPIKPRKSRHHKMPPVPKNI